MAASGSLKTTAYDNRYLEFTWSEKSQSIETNETVISYTLKGAGSRTGYYQARNIKLVIDGETVFTFGGGAGSYVKLYNGTVVTSGEFTIAHDADGSRDFTVTVEAGIYVWAVNCTGSDKFTLNPIPRASTLTAYNGSLNAEHTLTINRAADTFKHRLTYRCGDVAGYIAGGLDSYTTATSIKWTPPIGLAAENTTGTSVTVTLTLYTYASDGTHIGTTTKVITCAIPVTVVPTCKINWTDEAGHLRTYGGLVQGLSKLRVTLSAQTAHGAEIKKYTTTVSGIEYSGADITTAPINTSGPLSIFASVKDSRGRTGSDSATTTVLAYAKPAVSKLTVHRCDEDGTENDQGNFVRATFSAAVTNLAGKNRPKYVLKYRKSGSGQYTEVELTELASTYTVTDFFHIFAADANSTYDVEVTATDNHGAAARATSASTAFTLMNWHPTGTGMGVGKVSEKENTLEVALTSEFIGPVHGRAYGLGDLPSIPDNADLNSYLTPGVYGVRSSARAETLKNMPVLSAGRLIVAAALGQEDQTSKWRYIEQIFIPHNRANGGARTWMRYVTSAGTDDWIYSPWITEALEAYPVGSIHLRYDHTDPAALFGGTWTRITSYLLRGATASDTIGSTGTLADGSGRTYVNISIWRRTA